GRVVERVVRRVVAAATGGRPTALGVLGVLVGGPVHVGARAVLETRATAATAATASTGGLLHDLVAEREREDGQHEGPAIGFRGHRPGRLRLGPDLACAAQDDLLVRRQGGV